MKYKLMGNNDFIFDLEENIARNRGVKSFKELEGFNTEHHWSLLPNIQRAVDCLVGHMKRGSKIHIIVDFAVHFKLC